MRESALIQLQYVGFEHVDNNTREFIFHGIVQPHSIKEPQIIKVIRMSLDLLLLSRHKVGIQEGPVLCLRRLDTELEGIAASQESCFRRDLAEDDIRRFAAEKEGLKSPRKTRHTVHRGLSKSSHHWTSSG